MNTIKFQQLIQSITKRGFIIKTNDIDIQNEKEYYVYIVLPISKSEIGFNWKTPKTDEKMLRSFITAFTSKYREPNPRAYDWSARTYGESARWENKTDKEKEFAYYHHSSNMYRKTDLMKQIEDNFNNQDIETIMIRYGFYPTEYGIGIFCFWETEGVINAINKLKQHLNSKQIPYNNEYSDARWVFRFKIGLSKEIHSSIIESIN